MSEQFVVHVVDDDLAVRDSLSFMLGSANLQVRTYESAVQLLDRVDELERGIVITDVRMPGMSGLDLVARLAERNMSHPIIVLTGHADVAMAVEAMKAGVIDFIEKPFDDEALLAAVALARQRLEGAAGQQAEREEVRARIAHLTPREKDVFEAIAAGESNKSAAQRCAREPCPTWCAWRCSLRTAVEPDQIPSS
jgi:two-component system response regulator FixJ